MWNQLQPQLRTKRQARICACLITALLVLPGCHMNRDRREDRGRSKRETESWGAHVNTFLEAYFKAHPDFAVRAGRHEFDGQLPDWSPEGIRKTVEFLREEQDRLRDYKDRDLEEAEHFERDYLEAVVNADLFWLETAEWPQRNPYYYADAVDPDVYVSRAYAPLDQRLCDDRKADAREKPHVARNDRLHRSLRGPTRYRDGNHEGV